MKKQKAKPHHILVLYVIFLHEPCTWSTILSQFISVRRFHGKSAITIYLKELVLLNYIIRDANKFYSLTDSGLSLLKDIENRLRKERHDK